MRVAVSQAAIDPEIGRTIGTDIDKQRVRLIQEKLLRHKALGRICDDVDVEAVAYTISALGFSVGFINQTCFGEGGALARRVVIAATRAIAAGISAEKGR
jgi:hypothetical protein